MTKKDESCDYTAEVNRLKTNGPERLYILHGPETYLRDMFAGYVRELCVPEGEDSFNYRRFEDDIDTRVLSAAIDAMPFMGDRTLIELHDTGFSMDESVFSDIPDYCTVMFICQNDPDSRLKTVKAARSYGRDLYFGEQPQSRLVNWIQRRFESKGKKIGDSAARRLIFISGDLMGGLIPEIDKIAAYSSSQEISEADVNSLAHHIPEADTFEMIDRISRRDFDGAVTLLAEILSDKDNSPVAVLSALGFNLRRMYGRILEGGKAAFTEKNIKEYINFCCDCEYRFKKGEASDAELLKEAVIHIITNESK